MAEDTTIEWADSTFNPWEGCQETGSPACVGCYARERNKRFAPKGQPRVAPNWGPHAPRRRTSIANWRKPLKWEREAKAFYAEHKRLQRVFCASLADVFDNAVDPQWRKDLFDLIRATPSLNWLLLTKRIGNVPKMLREIGLEKLPKNVWLGITVVTQKEADRDVPKLGEIAAVVRFLSVEPMIEGLDLRDLLKRHGIGWVIVGGMSGAVMRAPMHPAWPRALRDQCAAAGVPFLFKQWGEWVPANDNERAGTLCVSVDGRTRAAAVALPAPTDVFMKHVGKKKAGRLLDGRTHDEFPVGVL